MAPDPNILQTKLGYPFRDLELLRLALTHPSATKEPGDYALHNQRLEFLGDAVLQLVLTEALYDRFPCHSEGPLTKARAQMVNQQALAERARRLEVGRHLFLSRGEIGSGGRSRPSILADAFEALVGAIFLDGGFEAARQFVLRQFFAQVTDMKAIPRLSNPKGELQELLQATGSEAPHYHVETITGPDHNRVFECAVGHHGLELGRGKGKSKKAAETQAALAALRFLRKQGLP